MDDIDEILVPNAFKLQNKIRIGLIVQSEHTSDSDFVCFSMKKKRIFKITFSLKISLSLIFLNLNGFLTFCIYINCYYNK
jgi:hypothetical protein